MLKGGNPDPKTFHQAHEHQHLILAIGMTMNPSATLQNLPNCFQLQVAPRFGLCSHSALTTGLKAVEVFSRGGKPVGDKGPHPHSCLWKTAGEFVAPVWLLNIFAQREFDARWSIFEHEVFRARPIA